MLHCHPQERGSKKSLDSQSAYQSHHCSGAGQKREKRKVKEETLLGEGTKQPGHILLTHKGSYVPILLLDQVGAFSKGTCAPRQSEGGDQNEMTTRERHCIFRTKSTHFLAVFVVVFCCGDSLSLIRAACMSMEVEFFPGA